MLHVYRESRATGVLIDEQDALPRLSTVRRAVYASFLLRAGDAPERTDVNDVRIRRMHDDASDAAGLVEPHVLPRRAGVRREVDTVAHDVGVADRPRLAGARPHHVRIGRSDCERADGLHLHRIEDGAEGRAAIARFPDPTRRGAEVPDPRIAGNAGDRREAAASRGSHQLKAEGIFRTRWRPASRRLCRGTRGIQEKNCDAVSRANRHALAPYGPIECSTIPDERSRARRCQSEVRSVRTGSSPAARLAGTRHAPAATRRTITVTMIRVTGSAGATSYRNPPSERPAIVAASTPIAQPMLASTSPSRTIIRSIADGWAPSATRIPISLRRCVTA